MADNRLICSTIDVLAAGGIRVKLGQLNMAEGGIRLNKGEIVVINMSVGWGEGE